ncbi:MAG: NAD(P)-binding domain-containing protein [Leptospirales bacterium]|jgi:glutamyl-tRNA reductase
MDHIGCVILSFEEAGDLSGVVPWKDIRPEDVYEQLHSRLPALGGFIFLSTCNRVEVIYTVADSNLHGNFAVEFTDVMPRLRPGLRPSFLSGNGAIRHLLRLSAGLESMVLGETEIRAQLKESFESAVALDKRLKLLFQNLFRESREIRSQIPLNHLPLSVATLATGKLAERLGRRHRRDSGRANNEETRTTEAGHASDRIGIIGSGPMSQQSARYLAKMGCPLVLINRTPEKVQELADSLNATVATRVVGFDEFLQAPERVGPLAGLVTATSRIDAFITPEIIARLRGPGAEDSKQDLVLIDMALPRDVAPACEDVSGVEVIHMDSMREELAENRRRRRLAAAEADLLIDDILFRLNAQMISDLSAPVMTRLQKNVRNISRRHLDVLLEDRLSHLSARDRRVLYDWAIRANRELNRLHKQGLEDILRHYYGNSESKADAVNAASPAEDHAEAGAISRASARPAT